MSGLSAHGEWVAALRAGADVPPRRPRLPLWWQDVAIGSVEPAFMDQMGLQPSAGAGLPLQKTEQNGLWGWRIEGDLTPSLARIAFALRDAGLAHVWRDEQLAVTDGAGRTLGTVERAVVRPLGITTFAVHLMAQSSDGRHWVQRRSLSKPNDPGLWDTLMGGMVPASDSLDQALARETWEEAGLRMDQLQALVYGGRVTTRRPADSTTTGYVVEHIDWYRCVLPDGVVPANQDGEVQEFQLMPATQVVDLLLAGRFTTEAALILADSGL